jgi:SRSO17 transposase
MIAISGANERGSSLVDSCLPEQNMILGKTENVYPMIASPFEAIPSMPNIQWPFSPSYIITDPLRGSLNSFRPATVEVVSHSPREPLWDQMVQQYHYLSYQKLLGRRLKYLAFIQDRPVAALSFSAPALKLCVRDCYIGWSAEQRKTYLDRIANNSRFLIFPWVQVPHLASHVLALTLRRLNQDWEQQFHRTLWLLETFVDPCRFQGTSYKAANWHCLGQTQGFGKQGPGYVYHGSCKEVYVYVLEPDFRKIIGCESKPPALFPRPSPFLKKVEELSMILRHADWSPDLVPGVQLTEKDVQAIAEELIKFHQQFHGCFARVEQHRLGLAYFSGLMSNLEAKSVEPIALAFLDSHTVRPMQRFMKEYRWDHEEMEAKNQVLQAKILSSPDSMLTVDSCEFPKKGKESVGVARQYCGALGKVDNCQSGVFVGYSSLKGYGLLIGQLYMPQEWFSPEYEQRRKDNLVPDSLTFQTKPQIALALIQKITQQNLFPAKWIGFDTTFGSDPSFLASLPKAIYYLASIRSNTQVFLKKPKLSVPPYSGRGRPPKKRKIRPGQPQLQTVSKIAKSRKTTWQPVILAEGAKGPIIAEIARLRVFPSHARLPQESSVWLLMRRNPDGQIKYALSNAPEEMPFSEMAQASTLRWGIEQCFEDGKNHVGMGSYEHRSWPAWHRHMIYVFLGLHFLLRLRIQFKKNSSADPSASPQTGRSSTTSPLSHTEGSNRTC